MADKERTPKTKFDHAAHMAAAHRLHQGVARILAHGAGTKLDIENRFNTGADITSQPSLKAPATYHQRARMVRAFYARDGLFAYLINRAVHFSTTPTRIRALARKDENKEKLQTAPPPKTGKQEKPKRPTRSKGLTPKTMEEQEFWDEWARKVNLDVDNTLPGIDRVKAWNLKNMLLDGMSAVVMEIGEMKVGKKTYIVPTKLTTLPGELLVLNREITPKDFIARERVYVNIGTSTDMYNVPVTLDEIMRAELPEIRGIRDFDPKKFRASMSSRERQYGYVVKFNHSPSDPSTLGNLQAVKSNQQRMYQTHGLYPNPPFASLQSALTLRQQGENSDLAILDAIINQILMIKVGDERHDILPTRTDENGNVIEKGTLEAMADLITADEAVEHLMQLILPYYVEIEKIETNTEALVKAEKYLHGTLTVMSAFGLFIAPPQVREQFKEANMANFEEYLDYLIGHHTEFMNMLAMKMTEWNSPTLSSAPTFYNLPTNTKTAEFLSALQEARTRGEISHQTLMDHLDLNARYERQVIAQELADGTKETLDKNVPIQFVQQTGPGEGGTKSGGNKPGSQGKNKGGGGGKTTGQSKPSGQRKSGNQVQSRPRTASVDDSEEE